MSQEKINQLLQTAEQAIASARTLLDNVGEGASAAPKVKKNFSVEDSDASSIVEGVFDGEKMLGPDGKGYPVPHNYASKSKLVPGDLLKLTITQDGRFVYKNIGPIERKTIMGVITYEDGVYRVLAEDKSYRVLTASVTFFNGKPGDQIAIIVPANHDSSWAAVEAIITSGDTPEAPAE